MKRTLRFILFLFITTVVYSQNEKANLNDLHFHLINSQNGLSNNVINDITQDSLGFIWIATYDGLNRYDGSQFLKFRKNLEDDINGVSNNYIQELLLLQNQKLLIATDAGLNVYDLKSETFHIFSTEEGLLDNSISALALDNNHNPVIGTYRGGVQIASDNFTFNEIRFKGTKNQLSSNEISAIESQGKSIYWVGTYHKGLNKVTVTGNQVKTETIQHPKLSNSTITELYLDSEQNLWIASTNGLFVIQPNGELLYLNKATTKSQGLSDSNVLAILDDNKGKLYIGTRDGGLNILEKKTLLDQSLPLSINWFLPKEDGSSVYDRSITSLFIDKHNALWMGTPTGINYVDLMGEPAKRVQETDAQNSISNNRVSALALKSENQIWIGTDGEGLDLYDLKEGKIAHYRTIAGNRNSLSNNNVLTLLPENNDIIWVGTYQGGINKINYKTGEVKHYLEGSQQNGSDVRTIFKSENNTIWVGTNRGGLFKYNRSADAFEFVDSLGKLDIRGIDEREGHLWLATFGSGLIKFNKSNGEAEYINSNNVEGLNTDIFFAIKIKADDNILLGTRYNGLKLYDPIKNTVETYGEKDGLSNNSINNLLIEDDKYVWISTYNGIDRYNLGTGTFSDFNFLSNIQNEGLGSILSNGNGKIFIGGLEGLQIINTAELDRLQQKKDIVLKRLSVLNKPILPGCKTILKNALPYENEIALSYFQNSFSFYFTALQYPVNKNILYSYKLENYNDYWIDTQEGIANFTDVPPGDYNLQIKTKSGAGTETTKNLAIYISPPFWKTSLAYIFYLLAFCTIIYLIFRYYSERLKLKNKLILEQEQRRLEHNLNEERLRFFTAFSHELKTPLTLILAPLDNLLSEAHSRSLKKQLKLINRNAKKLSGAIDKLLEFRKSEEGLSKLIIGAHNISYHLKKWVKSYAPLAIDKNIKLKTDIEKSTTLFEVDIEKLKVIINNLLSNAIKYCSPNCEVTVCFYINKETLDITVSDNGAGIAAQELQDIFNWYYRSETSIQKNGTGIGLALSKRFAELHNGKLTVTSIPNKKTTFSLEIPKVVSQETVTVSAIALEENHTYQTSELKPDIDHSDLQKDNNKSINASEDRPLLLIIDDNPDILDFLDQILKTDFDLIFAEDGEKGIQKATKFIPDLIVSDVMMPKKTGIDLCRALKCNLPTSHIPIILLTAKGNSESLKTGYEEGADDYIAKPFQPQLLKTRIINLIRNRKAVQRFINSKQTPEKEEEKTSPALNREKEFLSKLDAIINENIGGDTESVFDIARDLGMSRTSLYRKLKSITGYSINEYIRNLKLEKAADYIENHGYSVSQAAYEVGFNSPKYFRKIFKEMYGKLPSEFKS
ncbi:two component regulator with propeller domain [Leeuwenhoekiella aestuarii]|uniref:histidine kinase n=1 Tax=Leeuwenhoekiella aestuarii TaxID=2249426 RepID=A0A4Q0NPC6_9FLAO|nr:two-component regulator propeller domain-containing protein [Leeuwenhoekiella aestuarii]RXG11948.1 two component regulator with propeller domain [Leeuwenhoekiella aestuarii]RXG13506.1 two component regulator with propeller domain [Leeuwenhoekiella aestuarii]